MRRLISWFARNGVAANLLMVSILALGGYALLERIPLEVFPTFELDIVTIRVPFRGATPVEVEKGVTIRVEEAIHDLEGIKELRSTASEGIGTVVVELAKGYDARKLLDDVKLRVDAISTFPADTERPIISVAQIRREVISVVVTGALAERELRRLGEQVRDDLLNLPEITQVDLAGVRPYEISIEVSESALRSYGLTLAEVAEAVNRASMDLSAGTIKTRDGEVLIRSTGQAYVGSDFERIVVLTREDGTRLTVKDVATVHDGFEEKPVWAQFDNRSAVVLNVFRVGDQSAMVVAGAVKQYIAERARSFPEGVDITYWRDRSRIVKARINTLTNSALQGGALILLLLSLFLRWSVAFWVFIGVPISFMGGLALMPELGISINIISLFAFILVLGIVVDDAIVTGENIYKHLQAGEDPTAAAIRGTHEVAVPVTFGLLTTVAAFLPLLMIEGTRGKLFAQIPMIVIPVLLFSLVESKLILPAHLKHVRVRPDRDRRRAWPVRIQRRIAGGLEAGIERLYRPALAASLRQRYLSLAMFTGVAIVVYSLMISGHLRFVFFPRVQSELARASLVMSAGTPFETTTAHVARISRAAEGLRERYVDPNTGESIIKGILATSGGAGQGGGGQSNIGSVVFQIAAPEERALDVTSSEIVKEWRRSIGSIPDAEELSFRAEIGRGGNPIDVQLSGSDLGVLQAVAEQVKAQLRQYPGVFDIADTAEQGKQEVQLRIKPEAELLGLSLSDLARQVRQAFFGYEAQRVQRGRDDVRVMVRYPISERQSLQNLRSMYIRTPAGVEVPFSEVAEASLARSPANIKRVDRNRTLNVSADFNKETANVEGIKAELEELLSGLTAAQPGVRYSLEGEAREQRESFRSLTWGLALVLFVVYALLAIPFRSYLQPIMVMLVIPFGVVGAAFGHIMMGMSLSIMSLMGMLALCGVVVNDSLVLVDYINRRRREGMSLEEAVRVAGVARFRPVLLTSLTTFAGLTPLIFEKSTQAQFLIPMAVSLGFGVLFATFITLLFIPAAYMVLEDLQSARRRLTPQTAH